MIPYYLYLVSAKRNYKKIVVKVGTNVLTEDDGILNVRQINDLTTQLAEVKRQGIDVILVSSGAVGAGLSMHKPQHSLSRVSRRQLLAAIGQPRLINLYMQAFAEHDLHVAQILATKEDFRDRLHYLHMRQCFQALIKEDVVPVVNENDVIAVDELMFTDNDELATLVASMIDADALFILSNVDGVFDRDPADPAASIISKVDDSTPEPTIMINSKSKFGRGGMHTKWRVSQKVAQMGIHVHIANGRSENILLKILKGDQVGTHFQALQSLSPVKKWIAYQNDHQRGAVSINEGAAAVLKDANRATSLLPVGITSIIRPFSKHDVIRIKDEHGKTVGLGRAQYSSETLQRYLGQKGRRALVHYDYLFITSD